MENLRLYGKITSLQREMTRENNAMLLSHGVTSVQLNALIRLHVAEKENRQVCQRDLERELSMRASSVSAMLSVLEKDGYVGRRRADGDERTKIVGLTDSGRELCVRNKRMMDRCDQIVQQALSEEEQHELSGLLDKVLCYIRERK